MMNTTRVYDSSGVQPARSCLRKLPLRLGHDAQVDRGITYVSHSHKHHHRDITPPAS